MVILICCGLAITLPRIHNSICYDEACTVDFVKLVPFNLTGMLADGNNLPAYYFFMRAWTDVFGLSENALRVPGIIIYLMSVLLVYLFGKRLFPGYGPAFVAAVFYLLMWINTFQAGLARPYGMLAFLSTASLWLFYEIFVMENKSPAAAAVFIMVNITGSLTHIWFFFAGFAQVMYYLGKKNRIDRRFFAVFAASYLPFFIIWGGALYSQLQNESNEWMDFYGNEIGGTFKTFTFAKLNDILLLFCMPVIAGFCVKKYQKKNWGINGGQLYFLLVIISISLLVPFIISYYRPIYVTYRGPIIAAAPFALLIAGYLCSISYRPFFYAVFALFTVYNYIILYPFVRIDFYNERNLTKWIMYGAAKVDTVAIYGEMKRPIHYYLNLYKYNDRAAFVYFPNIMEREWSQSWKKLGENDRNELEKKFYDMIAVPHKRLLFVFAAKDAGYGPIKKVFEKLNNSKTMVQSQTFFGETLFVYK